MGKVSNIDEFRPHVTVMTSDKNVHVIPVSLIEDWGKGLYTPPPEIMEVIIRDWLAFISSPD